MIGVELLDRLERGFQACGRESRKERFGDSRIDLHTADVEAVLAPAVDDVLAGAVISGRREPAAVVYGQAPTAVSAYGEALQECCAFSHGTPALVRSRTDVLRQALLVRLEGIPIDVSGMMVTNEHRPLLAVALSDALSDSTARIEIACLLGAAIHINAGIERVGEDLVDLCVSGGDPAEIDKAVGVQRKAQALRAEPQPHASCRAEFGKAVEDSMDRGLHRLVRMQQHLPVGVAPYQTHRQPAVQFSACGLVADATEQPRTQHMQLCL
ncbi:hypothetical protein ABIC02_007555 [Bradyrhizobium sp. RT5a]